MRFNLCFIPMFVIVAMAFWSPLHAQVKMNMQMKADPATEQLFEDMMNRRVSISPSLIPISRNSKTAVFEFANPTKDTLRMEISISNSVPGMTKRTFPTDTIKKKSLIEEETSDSMSIYKPLSQWLSRVTKNLVLAPGEKKSIEVVVAIPDSVSKGEYVAWIVAEVAPRVVAKKEGDNAASITAIKPDGVLITVSSGKLLYTVSTSIKSMEE